MTAVGPVEEAALLLAVRLVLRGVQVDGDAFHASPEALPMPRDHGVHQGVPHRQHLTPLHAVLEAGEGGLRREGVPSYRVPIEQQLLNRIVAKAGRIVPILIPTRDPVHPLPHQVREGMPNATRIPRIT